MIRKEWRERRFTRCESSVHYELDVCNEVSGVCGRSGQ
jgi:hypothetical protein